MEVLIPITFFISGAAVLILRPMTRRLGVLLETMALERRARLTGAVPGQASAHAAGAEAAATRLAEHISRRLDLIEERMEFLERLADARERDARKLAGMS